MVIIPYMILSITLMLLYLSLFQRGRTPSWILFGFDLASLCFYCLLSVLVSGVWLFGGLM